jgi:hypothetical protein
MNLADITARLAAEHRAEHAPLSVERTVLAEFDSSRRLRRRWKTVASATVAATLAASAILVWQPAPAPAIVKNPAPVITQPALVVPPVAKVSPEKRPRPGPRRIPEPVEAAREEPFIAIPYTAPLLPDENLRIVRMTLSPSALAAAGFPLPAIDASAGTPSEVLVGEDGRARAIRIIASSILR